MLVCPHCQSENPDTHRFCQKCGESLTETTCSICGKAVSFEAEFCPNCSAATGTIWRAILTPAQSSFQPSEVAVPPKGFSNGFPENFPKNFPSSAAPIAISGKYLEAQQRYQLLDSLSGLSDELSSALMTNPSLPPEIEVRVLDRYPLQSSPLETLHHPDAHFDASAAVEIPASAQPYLDLQEQHPSLPLPRIHDAWQQDGIEIVLLEDRMHLPLLLDFWRDEQVLPLQILHWLHEMAELWAVLQPQHCCRSLLVLQNLRVDEDYLLCLQRFYADDPQQPPQLKDLGQLWQTLFQQSQRTQWGDLARLYSDLESGAVPSLVELRSRIEQIATTLQPRLEPTLETLPFPPNTPAPLNPFRRDDAATPCFQGAAEPMIPSTDELKPAEQPLEIPAMQLTSSSIEPKFALKPDSDPVTAIAPAPLAANMNELEVEPTNLETSVSTDSLPNASSLPEENGLPNEDSLLDSDDSPTVVLPMQLIALEDAGATDIGRQRDHNEDSFSIQSDIHKLEGSKGKSLQAKGLYILCDGMGGHAGGEVASALAVETLQQYFATEWQDKLPSQESIRAAIQQANQAIYDYNQENARSGSGRMGTTLVLVLVQDTEVAIAHVGDSRLYRLSRRCGLERLTVDHEVGQREIQRGVEPAIAYARPDAYQLTQALGPRDENFVNPDVRFVELTEDVVLLLCSDGLTDNDLLETYYQTHLEPLLSSQNSLEQGVQQLMSLANQYNGHDNITAIAIRAKVRPNLDQFAQG
jgi:protein phosphatase